MNAQEYIPGQNSEEVKSKQRMKQSKKQRMKQSKEWSKAGQDGKTDTCLRLTFDI